MKTPQAFGGPYPGLRPFERHEDALFFGRDEQVDQLLDKLDETHFLAVLGTSGSGKSSLVRAGLLPALDSGYMAGAGACWDVAELRPGDQPFRRLSSSLIEDTDWGRAYADSAPTDRTIMVLEQDLRRGSMALNWRLGVQPLHEGTRLLILVDQFEELFRYQRANRRDAADFVALLLVAATHPDVYLVITLRSEFLGDCSLYPDLPEVINRGLFLTPSLTPEQMADAVQLPAELLQFGGSVEPDLVRRLLDEARGQTDQLPLLQHALMRLWDLDDGDKRLTLTEFEGLGGLRQALNDHVEEAFADLDPEQQRIAEVLFRGLTERGSAERDTRRPVRLGEIAALAGVDWTKTKDVVEVFRKPGRSFLMPPAGTRLTRDSVLDITHEALIRQWRRLRDWTANEAEQAELYQRLESAARRHKKGKGALWIDPDLQIALQWLDEHNPSKPWAQRYGGDFDVAMDFLDQSRDGRDAKRMADERRAAEEMRQKELAAARERELVLTKESAKKERRLRAKEARLRKRWQWTFALAVVCLFLAIVGGWWAFDEATDAKKAQAALEVEKIRDLYRKTRDSKRAIDGLGRVIRDLDPESPSAYAVRGRVYADLAYQAQPGTYSDAKDNSVASRERSMADTRGENYASKAIQDLNKSLFLKRDQPEVLVTRAEVHRARGDLPKALEDYDSAIRFAPKDPQLYYNRGALRASAPTPDVAGALADYTKAIGIRPAFGEAYLARADLYQRQGARNKAINDYVLAIEYADDEETRVAAATNLEKLDDKRAKPQQQQKTDVFIHYVDKDNRQVAEQVRSALQPTYRVQKVELVEGGRTTGDVRYFVTDDEARLRADERAATAIADVVEKTLAKAGYKVKIQKIPLDQKKWTLGRAGLIEVWIPWLSKAAPQLIGRDELF